MEVTFYRCKNWQTWTGKILVLDLGPNLWYTFGGNRFAVWKIGGSEKNIGQPQNRRPSSEHTSGGLKYTVPHELCAYSECFSYLRPVCFRVRFSFYVYLLTAAVRLVVSTYAFDCVAKNRLRNDIGLCSCIHPSKVPNEIWSQINTVRVCHFLCCCLY